MLQHEMARSDDAVVTCVDDTRLVLKVPATEKVPEQSKQFTFNAVLNENAR